MDPQELGRLRDFSDTLTHVLAQLDGKFRELNTGGTKLLAINSTLDKHSQLLQNLEKSRDDQSKSIQETIQVQTNLSRDVLDITSKQCAQIQTNLIDLRSSTKQELDKLHGNLKMTFFDSLEEILSKTYTPAAEFPTITRDMAPDKILSVMNGRINSLEAQMKIQMVTNQQLKSSLTNEAQLHDKFDELSSKIVQLERAIESERRKISKIDKQVSHLNNIQGNVDRSLKLIDQKISLLTSSQFCGISNFQNSNSNSNGSTDLNQSSVLQLLQTPLPDLNSPSDGILSGQRVTVKDPAKIHAMKSFLREKKLSMRVDTSSGSPTAAASSSSTHQQQHSDNSSPTRAGSHITSPSSGMVAIPPPRHLNPHLTSLQDFDDEIGNSSVDSQGLLDEYVLERIENLDTLVNETLLNKFHQTEKLSRQMTHELKSVQDSVKELELISSDLTTKGAQPASLLDYDYALLTEKNFKSLSYDLKEQWEKVWEELEKKINKIDNILKQSDNIHDTKGNLTSTHLSTSIGANAHNSGAQGGVTAASTYDEMTKKLINFKNKIKYFFDLFSQCLELSHDKEGLLTTLSPCLNDLLRESHEILRTEITVKDTIQNKQPGVTLPISFIVTKLPEILKITQKKTIQFLNKGINKLDLLAAITSLQDLITTLVPQSIFQQNNDDIKIALTLKADQKVVDNLSLKKASLVDLQKFREYVNDEIDSMRETLVKNASNSMKLLSNLTATNGAGGGAGGGGGGGHGPGSDQYELNERFQIIISQFHDLKKSISGYVPRPEIETALQAILDEIRILKRVSVEKDQLNERLKTKADRDEVDRLLNLLSSSIGSPANGTAIAMHLKCLSCDKPLNPFHSEYQRPHTRDEEDERDRSSWGRDMSDSPKARPNTTATSSFSKGGLLVTSKSTSQLPPVGGNPSANSNERQTLKSRQNSATKGGSHITTSGIQGSFLSRS